MTHLKYTFAIVFMAAAFLFTSCNQESEQTTAPQAVNNSSKGTSKGKQNITETTYYILTIPANSCGISQENIFVVVTDNDYAMGKHEWTADGYGFTESGNWNLDNQPPSSGNSYTVTYGWKQGRSQCNNPLGKYTTIYYWKIKKLPNGPTISWSYEFGYDKNCNWFGKTSAIKCN